MEYSTNQIRKILKDSLDNEYMMKIDKTVSKGSFLPYKDYESNFYDVKFTTLHSRIKREIMSGRFDFSLGGDIATEVYKWVLRRFRVITISNISKKDKEMVDSVGSLFLLYALWYTIEYLDSIDPDYFRENDVYVGYDVSPYVIDYTKYVNLDMVCIDNELEAKSKKKSAKNITYSYSNN